MFTLTSIYFILFLAAGVLGYYSLPLRFRWCWLLFTSMVFFLLASGIKTLPLLLASIIIIYTGARVMMICKTQKGRTLVYIITLILAISELFVLKYLVNLVHSFSAISGSITVQEFSVPVAPIGISYYMLSSIGYLTDVYWRTYGAQKNIFKYTLFCIYFPQMISGPFVTYTDMSSQLFSGRKYDHYAVVGGFQRIVWGFLKKIVIADRLSYVVKEIYDKYDEYTGFYILIGVICYALQLYCDFSGCLDIVLGSSETFGIKLPENFNTPFYSESLSEFWRRWHISLGIWFKTYVFYPVLKSGLFQKFGDSLKMKFGKKAGKTVPTYIGLMINWLLIGIWHGCTNVYMLAAAIIPCIFLICSDLTSPLLAKITQKCKINTGCFSFRLFRRIRTFLLMCIVFGTARSKSVTDSVLLFKNLFSDFNPQVLFDKSLLNFSLSAMDWSIVIFGLFIILLVDIIHFMGIDIRKKLSEQNLAFQWAVMLAGIFFVAVLGVYGPNYNAVDFIYGAF